MIDEWIRTSRNRHRTHLIHPIYQITTRIRHKCLYTHSDLSLLRWPTAPNRTLFSSKPIESELDSFDDRFRSECEILERPWFWWSVYSGCAIDKENINASMQWSQNSRWSAFKLTCTYRRKRQYNRFTQCLVNPSSSLCSSISQWRCTSLWRYVFYHL